MKILVRMEKVWSIVFTLTLSGIVYIRLNGFHDFRLLIENCKLHFNDAMGRGDAAEDDKSGVYIVIVLIVCSLTWQDNANVMVPIMRCFMSSAEYTP